MLYEPDNNVVPASAKAIMPVVFKFTYPDLYDDDVLAIGQVALTLISLVGK